MASRKKPPSAPLPKLVRDFVPDLIKESGGTPRVKTLHDNKEYLIALNAKLDEEVREYLDGYKLEELADVLEVVEAITDLLDQIAPGQVRNAREQKRSQRGGFAARKLLIAI